MTLSGRFVYERYALSSFRRRRELILPCCELAGVSYAPEPESALEIAPSCSFVSSCCPSALCCIDYPGEWHLMLRTCANAMYTLQMVVDFSRSRRLEGTMRNRTRILLIGVSLRFMSVEFTFPSKFLLARGAPRFVALSGGVRLARHLRRRGEVVLPIVAGESVPLYICFRSSNGCFDQVRSESHSSTKQIRREAVSFNLAQTACLRLSRQGGCLPGSHQIAKPCRFKGRGSGERAESM